MRFYTRSSSSEMPQTQFHSMSDGETLAYVHSPGRSPGVLFLPGFMSNMRSTKPRAILNFCEEHSLEFTALDYYCHGESSCSEEKINTIGRWMDDALVVLDSITTSPKQIIVGSSMGAWLMMLVARKRLDRIEGLLGIASAPDFTITMADRIDNNAALASQMQNEGFCDIPSDYDVAGYYRIHRQFLEEAETHAILHSGISQKRIILGDVPLRLIHGKLDKDIDFKQSQILLSEIQCQDKELVLVDEGDHRLSKPDEIKIILTALQNILPQQ